jgi:hypothetical protein
VSRAAYGWERCRFCGRDYSRNGLAVYDGRYVV